MKKINSAITVMLALALLTSGTAFAAANDSQVFVSPTIRKAQEAIVPAEDAADAAETPGNASAPEEAEAPAEDDSASADITNAAAETVDEDTPADVEAAEEDVPADADAAEEGTPADVETAEEETPADDDIADNNGQEENEDDADEAEPRVRLTMDDIRESLLEALDNDTYRTTLEALQDGGEIGFATESDAASGLQQTLVDLGCNIEIDGSAGPATFSALNDIQTAYGLETTDVVNAEIYEQLLPLVLIDQDEEKAEELLADYYEFTEDSSQYDYIKGCALTLQGRYFQAKEAFDTSKYADYEEKSAACIQPWPKNGELWHNETVYGQDMYVTFTVEESDDNKAMYFEIYQEDGTLASTLFLLGNGSVTSMLPGGIYRIKDASGTEWYGMQDTFGKNGNYEYMEFFEIAGDPYLTNLETGYEWKFTINGSENGGNEEDGTDVELNTTDWESWSADSVGTGAAEAAANETGASGTNTDGAEAAGTEASSGNTNSGNTSSGNGVPAVPMP